MSGGLINSPLHVYSSNILISLAESPLLFIMWPLSELDTTRLEEARGGPAEFVHPQFTLRSLANVKPLRLTTLRGGLEKRLPAAEFSG